MRRPARLVAAVAGLVAVVACGRGESTGALGRAQPPEAAIDFAVTSLVVEAAADPAAGAAEAAQAGVTATLDRWLDDVVIQSLRAGRPAGDLGRVFTASAGERVATSPDRAAFVPEGLPPVTGLGSVRADLELTALADPAGGIALVAAHVDLDLRGRSGTTPVSVAYSGEVVLVPDGDGWRLDGYDLRSTLRSDGGTGTTTAAS